MKLRLERRSFTDQSTIGTLCVDGAEVCYTLEDVQRGTDPATVKDWKIAGQSAIPVSTYGISITYSTRFKRDLPLLDGVPGFAGVRIHPGNTAADTEGCILVGRVKGPNYVSESRAAFNDLYKKIESALDAGDKVTLEIT